jgi:hypothetical protein
MPTTIDSAGITFNDTTSLTSANIGTAQLVNGSVTAAKLGTTEQTRIAKAWVNFDGTTSPGTIRSSYNVSSVTKNGTGDYTVNFATAMADANYSVSGSSINPSGIGTLCLSSIASPTSSNLRIETLRTSPIGAIDSSIASVQIFGN